MDHEKAVADEADDGTMLQGTGDTAEPVDRLYAIEAIAGKGKGLIATKKIAKGTRILSEVPAFRVPRDNPDVNDLERIITNEVKGLNEYQQRAFFDLVNIYGDTHSQALGISRTNVLPLGSHAETGGLFLEASRIITLADITRRTPGTKTSGALPSTPSETLKRGKKS